VTASFDPERLIGAWHSYGLDGEIRFLLERGLPEFSEGWPKFLLEHTLVVFPLTEFTHSGSAFHISWMTILPPFSWNFQENDLPELQAVEMAINLFRQLRKLVHLC
jgi:hypothetical protein